MVSVVFIERGAVEIELLCLPCAHVADITNQFLYLFLMSPYNDLRTVPNRNPAVVADRSELACHHWLAEELFGGMELVTAEPSNPGNPAEAWWSEFTREVNTCRLFGPGTNYSVVAGKSFQWRRAGRLIDQAQEERH